MDQSIESINGLRRLRGMSLRRLALLSGIPYDRCQRLLNGERRARPDELARLAEVLLQGAVHARE